MQWRSLLIVIHLFSFPSLVIAQDYQPMAVEDAHWITRNDDRTTPWIDELYSYTLRGDTIINGRDYKKMYKDIFAQTEDRSFRPPWPIDTSFLYAFLRDDTLQRKVFCRYNLPEDYMIEDSSFVDCFPHQEFLLFDFSVQKGDTLDWCMFRFINGGGIGRISHVIVDSVGQSAFYPESNLRKTIYTNLVLGQGDVFWESTSILEGIGFEQSGLFYNNWEFLASRCIGTNSTCNIISSTSKKLDHRVGFHPNPTASYLIIDDPTHLLSASTASIFDLNGQLIKSMPLNEGQTRISVYEIPPGIYFIKFITAKAHIATKRFIKY